MSRYTLFPGIPVEFHSRKFGSHKRLFSKMEESIGGRQENCMRDWRLELNSQSGFSRMCEYGFTENDYTVMWSDSKNGNAVEFEKNAQYMSAKEFTMDAQISVDMAKQICMM